MNSIGVKGVSHHRPCFPVLSDMGLITQMLDEGPNLAKIVLKGRESGFEKEKDLLSFWVDETCP